MITGFCICEMGEITLPLPATESVIHGPAAAVASLKLARNAESKLLKENLCRCGPDLCVLISFQVFLMF